MIFISGVGDSQKKLNYKQEQICGECGRQCFLELWVSYSYFSLFFIPVIKWNKAYYVTSSCCNTTYSVDRDIIKRLRRGDISAIPDDALKKEYGYPRESTCQSCGFVSPPDFIYCPKCGRRL